MPERKEQISSEEISQAVCQALKVFQKKKAIQNEALRRLRHPSRNRLLKEFLPELR